KWITYGKLVSNYFSQVMLYSLATGKSTAVSTPMHDDFSPSFDPNGKYLYSLPPPTFDPQSGTFEFDFQFRATDGIYVATLQDSLRSPVPPQSDEETGAAESDDEGKDADAKDAPKDKKAKKGKKDKGEEADGDIKVKIDLENITGRITQIPIDPARYSALPPAAD